MKPLNIVSTKDKVEFTVSEVGSSLFLQFSVETAGEEHPAQCYTNLYYHKKSSFTHFQIKGETYWMGCRMAHQDYLDCLMLGGPEALYKHMEKVYTDIQRTIE